LPGRQRVTTPPTVFLIKINILAIAGVSDFINFVSKNFNIKIEC